MHAYLDVTLNASAQTLFEYCTDLVLNWQNVDLTVKLYDDTPTTSAARRCRLPLQSAPISIAL